MSHKNLIHGFQEENGGTRNTLQAMYDILYVYAYNFRHVLYMLYN